MDLRYTCFDVNPTDVKEALQGIKALGIIGSNVTIPHKIEVIPYLDEVERNAAIIGSVNTIKNHEGRLIGYNTDGVGFIKSILDEGHILKDKHVIRGRWGKPCSCSGISCSWCRENYNM